MFKIGDQTAFSILCKMKFVPLLGQPSSVIHPRTFLHFDTDFHTTIFSRSFVRSFNESFIYSFIYLFQNKDSVYCELSAMFIPFLIKYISFYLNNFVVSLKFTRFFTLPFYTRMIKCRCCLVLQLLLLFQSFSIDRRVDSWYYNFNFS